MRFLIAPALAALLVVRQEEQKVARGQPVPDFEFITVLGGDGRTKLSEFHGQPVLIAWYSTVFAGVEGARAAVDMEEEFNKERGAGGLVVFLMEIKNHDAAYLRGLQMAELPGADCRLLRNQELPVSYDDATGLPPKMVLVGVDGTLLYAGSYQRSGEVKKLLKEELGKMDKGWGADPLARKARALGWGQGKLGEARTLLENALAQGGNEELTALAAEIDRHFEALARSVQYHLDQGEPRLALRATGDMAVAAAGYPTWLTRTNEAIGLAARESIREAELETRLDTLLKPTLKSKPKKGLDEKLRAFATGEANGTKVGARAARLADAVTQALGEL